MGVGGCQQLGRPATATWSPQAGPCAVGRPWNWDSEWLLGVWTGPTTGRWASLPPLILGLSQAQPKQLVGFLRFCHLGVCLHQRSFICVSAHLPEPSRYLSQADPCGVPPGQVPRQDRAVTAWAVGTAFGLDVDALADVGARWIRARTAGTLPSSGLSGGFYALSWLRGLAAP